MSWHGGYITPSLARWGQQGFHPRPGLALSRPVFGNQSAANDAPSQRYRSGKRKSPVADLAV
jgi:hypothetical protein